MDAAWLAAANAAIDANSNWIAKDSGDGQRDYARLQGTPRSRLEDAWSLPQPDCEPFRRMIVHPAVVKRLNWMMGSGYEATKCEVLCGERGSGGLYLHAGGTAQSETNHYRSRGTDQGLFQAWQGYWSTGVVEYRPCSFADPTTSGPASTSV